MSFVSCFALPSFHGHKKGDTRCRGSELQRNMGSGFRFDEIETEIGTGLPIQCKVSVSLYVSSLTQKDSKSETAKFPKNHRSSLNGKLKEANFSKSVSLNW